MARTKSTSPTDTQDWGRFLIVEPREPSPPLTSDEQRVSASPLDFSVQTLVDEVMKPAGRLYVDDWQRAYVWDNKKASRLIESLLLNIPLPVCYFAEDQDGRLSIIDGNQRIKSLKRYVNNEFPLAGLTALPESNRLRFHQLPARLQNHICTRAIRCIVIDKYSPPRIKFDVFSRLNTAATPLNDQELRNCLQRGTFNALLHELSHHDAWLQLMNKRKPDRRMRDAELILRFFLLTFHLETYQRPLHAFLTDEMDKMRFPTSDALDKMRTLFDRVVRRWLDFIGPGGAFRRLDASGTPYGRFLAGIFDAQMVGLARALSTTRSPNEVRQFTVDATRDDTPFMTTVLVGSSHVENVGSRIEQYRIFFSRAS